MKSISNDRPAVLYNLGNGSWHYNYNIKETEAAPDPLAAGETEQPARKVFEFETVVIWGTPDYDKCVKAVLRDRRDETEEFSLINKYNAFVLGLATGVEGEAGKVEYQAYLTEVLAVKAMVRQDLAVAGFEGEAMKV